MLWYASYIINKVTSGSNVATKKQDTHIINSYIIVNYLEGGGRIVL